MKCYLKSKTLIPRGVIFVVRSLETMEHFFFYCSKVRAFWDQVTVMLNSQGITFRSFHIKDTVFGFVDALTCDSDCMLLNYIILESKHLIYRTKQNKTSLSLKLLFEKIKNMFQIKCFLARKNNKLLINENKRKSLLQLKQQ